MHSEGTMNLISKVHLFEVVKLALTATIVIFGIYGMHSIGKDLRAISKVNIPLMESIARITDEANTSAKMIEQIATAAEEQSTVIHGISDNINSVSETSSQFAGGINDGSDAASNLSKMAEELRLLVCKFKVK